MSVRLFVQPIDSRTFLWPMLLLPNPLSQDSAAVGCAVMDACLEDRPVRLRRWSPLRSISRGGLGSLHNCCISKPPTDLVWESGTGKVQLALCLDKRHHSQGRDYGHTANIVSILATNKPYTVQCTTHKPPRIKMPDRANFCDRDITSFQIHGIGSTRSTTSVTTFGIATPRK